MRQSALYHINMYAITVRRHRGPTHGKASVCQQRNETEDREMAVCKVSFTASLTRPPMILSRTSLAHSHRSPRLYQSTAPYTITVSAQL
ncbi:hypothetical protein EVAR_53427_1 [Eumeta japonica]|uniref:Uncharacterized protein n=1 Tax=Eumeta variegata TaxID=151549 RepID=A0A4C1Y1F6_EUMVA|nr:hypothetical protein EVAR_53427_1 [Eumeta japonica]